jgi:hypothetical protein
LLLSLLTFIFIDLLLLPIKLLLLFACLVLLATPLFAQLRRDSSLIKHCKNITAKLATAFVKTIKRSPDASISVYGVDTLEVSGNRRTLIKGICGAKLFKHTFEIYIGPSNRHGALDLKMHKGIIPCFKLNRNNALDIPHDTILDHSIIPGTVVNLKLYDFKLKVQFMKEKLLRVPVMKVEL